MSALTITEITDPFCTWCWGAEPLLRRIEERYRDQVEFEFAMGGLVEDFETFRDTANDITSPSDVAPHWEAAAEQHGMPVDATVWRENPPESSYPASVAYEAAALLDEALAHDYLRRLREAVTIECRDIARASVLFELADEVGFDRTAFESEFRSERARERFEADRQFVRRSRASAFPSFRLEADGEQTWVVGFQPFDAFGSAIAQVAPDLETTEPRPIPDFVRKHGRVATQEVAAVYDMSSGRTMQALRSLQTDGVLQPIQVGNGYLWTLGESEHHDSHGPVSSESTTTSGTGSCSLDGECSFDA